MGGAPPDHDGLGTMLADRPDVLEHLTAAHRAAYDAVDGRLLELCRLRVAALIGAPADPAPDLVDEVTRAALPTWPTSGRFSGTERACLAFTEHYVVDVATLPDELAEAVVVALGGDGFSDFVHALLVVEQRLRLRAMWGRLFDEGAA